MARLTQQSADLLDYDEVREKLHAGESTPRGLEEILLDAIVGSVGRYTDFTRSFLPRRKSSERRWAGVKMALPDVGQFPPITVYKVGQVYFVLDGNHRVSIARQAGATHIPAYVTEIETKVSLSPDMQPDELICQAKYADFLEETGLDKERPSADFTVTAPGQYRVLLDQITRHQERLENKKGETVTLQEAADGWYDDVYLPVVRLIDQRGILRFFPGRTETDLYAWIARNRQELKDELGWDVQVDTLTDDLVARFSPTPQQVVQRVRERIVELLVPETLEAGPAPGRWRGVLEGADTLFREILTPMSASETGRRTLEQSLVVGQQGGGRLHGLYVRSVRSSDQLRQHQEELFSQQRRAAGVSGDFSVVTGKVMEQLLRRARGACSG